MSTPASVASDEVAQQDRGASWQTLGVYLALFVLVAIHVFVFEVPEDAPRPSWLSDLKLNTRMIERGMLWSSLALAGLVAARAQLRPSTANAEVPNARWKHRALKWTLGILVLVNGFNYFYTRRASFDQWWHCYDAYHYGLNPVFQEELGYERLYECTVQAAPSGKIGQKSRVRDLRTYGFTDARNVRAARGPECKARMSPERWALFKDNIDVLLDRAHCGPGRIRSALKDQGYNGTPFHTALIKSYFSVAPVNRVWFVILALVDILALCMAHAYMTRAVGWRVGYVFSLFAFTMCVDRFAIIGGSSLRFIWLACLIAAVAALIRRRWAFAGALFACAAMLTVFPMLFGLGALIALAGSAYRDRTRLPRLKRFVLGGLLAASICGVYSLAVGEGVQQYRDFMHDMEVHSEGPPNKELGGRLEKTPGFGVGLKFVFTYRGQHSKAHKGYNRVRLTREFAEIKPIFKTIAWGMTLAAGVLAFHLAAAEAAIMFGFIAFYCLLGTVGYYFSCASLICIACSFSRRKGAGDLMFLLFLATSIAGLAHLVSPRYTAVSMYRTITSFTWLVWIVTWFVWSMRRTGLLKSIEEPLP